MNSKNVYQKTVYACFIGYIVQAIVNNFVPLLFVTFQLQYHIPLSKITMLITVNFVLQLVIDLLSVVFVDKVGYRISTIFAHVCVGLGLILLTVLPDVLRDPFWGIFLAVLVYAVGGGLLEVLVSPIVEACPTDNKEKAMSLLHSFYCWGHVGVVLCSTLFFTLIGIQHWKILAVLWSIIPALNAVFFSKVPIAELNEIGEKGLTLKELIRKKIFWVFILIMMCAGACEQSVSQWASVFAEKGLGVSKTIGDLAGPMMFAVFMGLSRAFYGKYGEKIKLEKFMIYSGILCIVSYLLISFVPISAIGFVGCGLCGLSVGILWPGTFSMAAASVRGGGTAMFALLALAGDLGCSLGPGIVGTVSGYFGDNLKMGIFAAVIFPVLLMIGIIWNKQIEQADSHINL